MKFCEKKKYVRTDGWRGYEQPIYAVAGWNDTGSWSDSPCPTATGIKESHLLKHLLRINKIKFRVMSCQSSNVFCVHHYLIVPVEQIEQARKLVKEWYVINRSNTRLLYSVED
jgi:hypothetical protein